MIKTNLRNWTPGAPLTARQLQEGVTSIRELQRTQFPSAADEGSAEADSSSADPNDIDVLGRPPERWRFVRAETVTERIEDATDSSIYIDVERKTSVTVEKPDGGLVIIEFE